MALFESPKQKRELMTVATKTLQEATVKQEALLKVMKVRPDTFQAVLAQALIKNPALARCTKESLLESVFKSCQYQLIPDGRLGAIVPLNIKGTITADFWPMIDGYLLNARRALPGTAFHADSVFQEADGEDWIGDEWRDVRGSKPEIVHIVDRFIDRVPANLVCCYATAHMPDNPIPEFIVIYRNEILEMRKKNKGPWSTHFIAMAEIRPFKKLLKRMPISGDFATALGLDDSDEDSAYSPGLVNDDEPVDVTPEPDPDPGENMIPEGEEEGVRQAPRQRQRRRTAAQSGEAAPRQRRPQRRRQAAAPEPEEVETVQVQEAEDPGDPDGLDVAGDGGNDDDPDFGVQEGDQF